MTTLTDKAKELLDRPVFASLATINPDGSPQTSTMWVTRDGDDVLIGTLRSRQKARNMERDNRVSVLLTDPDDGYSYVEIRGTVTLDENGARDLMDQLSFEYDDKPFGVEPPEKVRVIARNTPTKVIDH